MVCHCDNLGAVAAINSGYSRINLLICLFFIRAHCSSLRLKLFMFLVQPMGGEMPFL